MSTLAKYPHRPDGARERSRAAHRLIRRLADERGVDENAARQSLMDSLFAAIGSRQ